MAFWDFTGMPTAFSDALLSMFKDQIILLIEPLIKIVKIFITTNIDPFNFLAQWSLIVVVLEAFYLPMFLLVGFKFLIGSYDATQRAEAKEWLKKSLLIIITVGASLLIYSILLELSSGTAIFLWDARIDELFSLESLPSLDLISLAFFGFSLFFATGTITIRNIYLIFGVMLFPIGLFMNFIPPLKPYGSAILNSIGAAAFLNVLDIILLLSVFLFWEEFKSAVPELGLFIAGLAFLFMGILNLTIFFFAIWKALGTAVSNIVVKQVLGAPTAIIKSIKPGEQSKIF